MLGTIMHVVAITRLATSVEQEAAALAASLAALPYTMELKLRVGLPAVVFETADEDRARALAAELRRRGHDALVCDTDDVVAANDMTPLRHFRFDAGALVLVASHGDAEVPWSDITALLRATHRTESKEVRTVTERKFNAGRAILTGGLSISKTTKREIETRTDDSEPVLYIFRRHGAPWLLGQYHANYGALGARLAPTAIANFLTTIERLRALATAARSDDRLMARRTTIADLDLLAHLLARTLAPAT